MLHTYAAVLVLLWGPPVYLKKYPIGGFLRRRMCFCYPLERIETNMTVANGIVGIPLQ